jgi:hypothetical protein
MPLSFAWWDSPAAGTYNYSLGIQFSNGIASTGNANGQLQAELMS